MHYFKNKKIFLLLVLFIVPVSVFAVYPLGDELILYNFEDDVVNSGTGGNTYDSALSGAAAFTATSKVGEKAVSFGASGDYVDTKYGNGLDPSNQSMSISYWINPTSDCTAADRHSFGVSVGVGQRMYIRCRLDNWAYRLGNNAAVDSGVAATIGGWNHIVLVLDASTDTSHFYINGEEETTAAIPSFTIGGDFWVGNFNTGGAAGAEGAAAIIDEVAIFDRALTSGEVTTIYTESQYAAPGTPLNLEAEPFDSGVYLSWLPVDSINGAAVTDYVIEYKENASGSWSTFADGVSTTRYDVVTGLTNGTLYNFRVSAVNSLGTGDPTSTVNATPAVVTTWGVTTTDSATFTASPVTLDFDVDSTFPYAHLYHMN